MLLLAYLLSKLLPLAVLPLGLSLILLVLGLVFRWDYRRSAFEARHSRVL